MLVAVLTLLSAVALGAASAMTAAITLAATALIAPGTGTHNITTVMGYLENARDLHRAGQSVVHILERMRPGRHPLPGELLADPAARLVPRPVVRHVERVRRHGRGQPEQRVDQPVEQPDAGQPANRHRRLLPRRCRRL